MTKQFYSYALDSTSRLIKADLAQKGNDFFCPSCGAIMVLRKGEKNRPHFAHKANVSNCSYETYLHKLAKRRISECFNNSPEFKIVYHAKFKCDVQICPIDRKEPCTWESTKEFDLKKYYSYCEEEVTINNFRADLMLIGHKESTSPILIEIYVTHKSTEEKLNSEYHIIEIKIESEEDINDITKKILIKESDPWSHPVDRKIRFYNFKDKFNEIPDKERQTRKYRFWIDSNGLFQFDKREDYEKFETCLSPNTDEIKNSIFHIESRHPINQSFGLYKLAESELDIRYCSMCKFYKLNEDPILSLCELYKTKGTPRFPEPTTIANNCSHFKQRDFIHEEHIPPVDFNQECKVTVKKRT
ncbi:MAG: hypothetical protein HDS60_06420 [Barnesiella sp.]|nr:hypothetical protein [Barnesiella sp.]